MQGEEQQDMLYKTEKHRKGVERGGGDGKVCGDMVGERVGRTEHHALTVL